MKDSTLGFTVLPHKDGAFTHHLEVGPFPSDFISPSVQVLFLRVDEEIGRPREVVDVLKLEIFYFISVIF